MIRPIKVLGDKYFNSCVMLKFLLRMKAFHKVCALDILLYFRELKILLFNNPLSSKCFIKTQETLNP